MKLTNSDFGHILATLQEAERAGAAVNRRRHSRLDLVGRVNVCDAEGRAYTALTDNICFSGVQLLQVPLRPLGHRPAERPLDLAVHVRVAAADEPLSPVEHLELQR